MYTLVIGNVDRSKEHFELRYGDRQLCPWDDMLPVARLGRIQEDVVAIEYLIDQRLADNQKVIEAVDREITYYIIEKGEQNPWGYAKYHCTSTASMYSSVRWSFYPAGWDFSVQTELNL